MKRDIMKAKFHLGMHKLMQDQIGNLLKIQINPPQA